MASSVAAWPTVALGEVLSPVSRPVHVDTSQMYSLLGMHWYAEGLYVKDRKLGAQIQADTLYEVKEGDFVYNRLFAWKGSFGLADAAVDGCFVSNEFPCFHVCEMRAYSNFLRWYFTQASVWDFVEGQSSGSTPTSRLRLKEHQFLALQVPLPPLDEQRRIVARIEELVSLIEEAKGLRREALAEAEALLSSERTRLIGDAPSIGWIPLRTYVERIENGWSPACESRPASDAEWGVLKVGSVSFGVFNPNENKALPLSLEADPRYEVRPGDFLMSRANTRELVGACAIVSGTRPRLMLSDKIFRFIFKQDAPVELRYLDHVLKSRALRRQIELKASGTSPTMKNISKEAVLGLLMPPYDHQQQQHIGARLEELALKIGQLTHAQRDTSSELNTLLPSLLDKAFQGEL